MSHFRRRAMLAVAGLIILLSCSTARTRYVSIRHLAEVSGEQAGDSFPKITVNDFVDNREDTERIGIDYTRASDIVSVEPVVIAVPEVVGKILEKRGFEVLRISSKKRPSQYSPQYDAEYHLTGVIEELVITVKGKGLLENYESRGRVHYSLHDREGTVIWAGRMRADSSQSSPFVTSTRKGIENSISECVKLLGEALVNDEKFIAVTVKR
jgi:hypothetical protein